MQVTGSYKTVRWLTLIIAIINISFDYILTSLTGLPSIKAVTDQYNTLFVPAPYTFAIWGIIYLAYLVYCIVQLLPSQKDNAAYDKLNIPFLIVNILGIVWVYAFRQNKIAFGESVIACMLLCAIVLFGKSNALVKKQQAGKWLTVPFALLLGWLSVAVIASTAVFFVSVNWSGLGLTAANWVMIVLGMALLLALAIGLDYRDMVYPLVIAWGTFGVWISLKDVVAAVAQAALAVAVLCFLIAIWAMLRQVKYNSYVKREDSL